MALETAAWTAIAFLMIGILLLLIEVLNPGFFIAVPGGTLAFMGAVGLIAPDLMFGTGGWFLWPLAAIGATAVNLYVYRKWAPAGSAPITMSIDSLPGETGTVTTEVLGHGMAGKVLVRGTTWSARASSGVIEKGRQVRVVRAEGVHIIVEPIEAP